MIVVRDRWIFMNAITKQMMSNDWNVFFRCNCYVHWHVFGSRLQCILKSEDHSLYTQPHITRIIFVSVFFSLSLNTSANYYYRFDFVFGFFWYRRKFWLNFWPLFSYIPSVFRFFGTSKSSESKKLEHNHFLLWCAINDNINNKCAICSGFARQCILTRGVSAIHCKFSFSY